MGCVEAEIAFAAQVSQRPLDPSMGAPMNEVVPAILKIYPIFAVEDLAAAIAFYRDKLDFVVVWQWGDPPTRAGVARDHIELQLLSDPRLRPSAPGQVYCQMVGVDSYFRQCVDRQTQIAVELADRPWGMKDFRVLDPSGNMLGFGEVQPKTAALG